MIENRAVGIKSRELYEAPAAITLIEAHGALEDLVLTKAELDAKRELEAKWTQLVYDGLWFSPVREAIDAFVATTQELVTGEVRVQLAAGAAIVTGRRSEYALYAETLASYGDGRDVPARGGRGLHPDHRARDRARGGARQQEGRGGVTALVRASVGDGLAPRGLGVPPGDDAELLPYDCEATPLHAERLARRRASSPTRSSTRRGARSSGSRERASSAERRGRPLGDRAPLGQVGRKIHAGRSRNDQVAAAFRLYVADACARGGRGDRGARRAPCSTSPRREADTPMPGYTHLQRAQPVTRRPPPARVGRDARARPRAVPPSRGAGGPVPLGAGALAGSTLPCPPRRAAMRNSLDAVADRDFALDYLYAARDALRAPLADRRGAVPLGDEPSSVSCAFRSRPRRARR